MAKKGGKRSGGGGGGKQRKYTRDNNGRFASTGTGATARGGRLKTASGNKRKTQTAKMTGSKTASTVAKPKGLKPGTLKPKAATKAANKVVASPRRLNKDQKIARDVMTDKRFRSDKQRREEMIKRGIKPKTDIVALVATVRAKQGGATTARIKPASAAAKPAAPKAAKPANKTTRAARIPKTGQEAMKNEVRKVQNKILRNLNAEIKSAGPNATNLRVEKLALKTKMIDTQPRQTAKQAAKSAKQDVVIRGRIAEMRKQNARVARAQANVAKNADVRNSATSMSKASFARKPSKKTLKSQLRADAALAFYANPAKALKSVNKRKPGFRLPRAMR